MKKKLEAELISIAHRILKLKNKEDVIQLHQEAQKLYEKLSILRFYEENFEALKPTLTHEELEEKIEEAYVEKEEAIEEVKAEEKKIVASLPEEIPVEEEKILIGQVDVDEAEEEEAVVAEEEEPVVEEEEEVVVAEEPKTEEVATPLFEPVMAEAVESLNEDKKAEPHQISFEDLLGNSYKEPEFVKVNDVPKEVEKVADVAFEKVAAPIVEEAPKAEKPLESIKAEIAKEKEEYKAASLNDKFSKTITLGLNDRIAFEKHLFGGSGEDLNRVLSQLNTFNSLEEAKGFIEDLVKPDYNNWDGKDEFSSRFMELVEKKFA